MGNSQVLFFIGTTLVAIIGYFMKRTLDRIEFRIDRIEGEISGMKADVADMKPQVLFLWEKSKGNAA